MEHFKDLAAETASSVQPLFQEALDFLIPFSEGAAACLHHRRVDEDEQQSESCWTEPLGLRSSFGGYGPQMPTLPTARVQGYSPLPSATPYEGGTTPSGPQLVGYLILFSFGQTVRTSGGLSPERSSCRSTFHSPSRLLGVNRNESLYGPYVTAYQHP